MFDNMLLNLIIALYYNVYRSLYLEIVLYFWSPPTHFPQKWMMENIVIPKHDTIWAIKGFLFTCKMENYFFPQCSEDYIFLKVVPIARRVGGDIDSQHYPVLSTLKPSTNLSNSSAFFLAPSAHQTSSWSKYLAEQKHIIIWHEWFS